jgi:hypothetical protein
LTFVLKCSPIELPWESFAVIPQYKFVNIGSPFGDGMNPEFVAQTAAVHKPSKIDTKRIA